MEYIRLDRFISNHTQLSRSDAKEALKNGKVSVNGKVQKSGDFKVSPQDDEVSVCGEIVIYKKNIYYMLNKPQGYVCATEDNVSETVIELLPEKHRKSGLFPVGRLDKDTEGLIILTDDGEFAHKVISPKCHVPKYYVIKLEKPFEQSYIERFAEGIVLDDGKCLSAKIARLDGSGYFALAELFEGRFHQVKRMISAVENKVVFLRRVQIGELFLPPEMPIGSCLEIMHKDVENVLKTSSINAVMGRIGSDFSSL